MPFGGVKDSGVGTEGGDYSLRFYSESKNVRVEVMCYENNFFIFFFARVCTRALLETHTHPHTRLHKDTQ